MNAGIATQVILGMSLFTTIILILVFIILAARSRLVASGSVFEKRYGRERWRSHSTIGPRADV